MTGPADLIRLRELYCQAGDPIGRAISTEREPNTTSHFFFWCSGSERRLQLGNIISAVGPDDITFGVITEMRSITDVQSFLADYLSHDYGRPNTVPPSELTELTVAKCAFLSNVSEQARPVGRAAVHFPTEEGLQKAMSLEEFGVPLGVFENGDRTTLPITISQDFIVGPEGAHINIAGISGLASKTSFALFTMRSIISSNQRAARAKAEGRRDMKVRKIAFLLFNVKSRDLLFLEQPNPVLSDDTDLSRQSMAIYDQCGVAARPFEDVRYFAPLNPSKPSQPQSLRRNLPDDPVKVEAICWEFDEIGRYIPSLFDKETWNDQAVSFWVILREHLSRNNITTFQNFFTELNNIRAQIRPQGGRMTDWNGVNGLTVIRWHRNFARLQHQYRGLIAANPDLHRPLPIRADDGLPSILKSDRLCVVDIQQLPDSGQRLVFDKVVADVQSVMEDDEQRREIGIDGVVIFVDELNKFAPSSLGSPLKGRIIEITARGRSSNVALMGAEQFASETDKQVLDNCATRVFGRTGSSEIQGQIYKRLSAEMRTKLLSLPQGVMLVDNNRFAEPLLARFPVPPNLAGDKYQGD